MPKEYGIAEQVENIATTLIPSYHPELATARMKYVWVDKASQKNGRPVLGKVRKISGVIQYLCDIEFLLEVPLDSWNELTPDQRRALVDHLLERCYGEEEEESGEMKWKVREPDVQEFSSILQRHGAWNEELTGFVSIAQHTQVDNMVAEVADDVVSETVNET